MSGARLLLPALALAALGAAPAAHAASPAPDDLVAECSWAGVLGLDNRMTFVLTGTVRAATAVETSITCELENSALVVVLADSRTCPGSACAVAKQEGDFPVAAVRSCVTASATYADTSVRTLSRQCAPF